MISNECVGIDTEFIDYERKLNSVNYALSAVELSIYNQLEGNEKLEYFYRRWVMKEAYFKMKGIGLSKTFNSCTVSNYPTHKIYDILGNPYYITSTLSDFELIKVEFNNINK